MLEEILDYIHNYFVKKVYTGKFKIESGSIHLDLLENQYYKIKGSVFNDGVYKYPSSELTDEEFEGEIWALAIPPKLIDISTEIQEYMNKYGETLNSPFQSESFGGYSYSKSSSAGRSVTGSYDHPVGAAPAWQGAFASRLNKWRKIS